MGAADPFRNVEAAIGHRFADPALLERALTHSSFANEASATLSVKDNETLEFLGDSVVGFLMSELLVAAWPDFREGSLSKARSHLVSETSFANAARRLGLGEALRLAAGETRSGGRVKDSLLADAFEAVVAALFLDGGLERARALVKRLFSEEIAALDPADLSFHDHKTTLQEIAQAEGKALPEYVLVSEAGPDHAKMFEYEVVFDGTMRARGRGSSKKAAQRQAAKLLLAQLVRTRSQR